MTNEKETPSEFVEGVDYTIDEQGLFILTKQYLLKRGFCCHQGCRNCPYGNAPKN